VFVGRRDELARFAALLAELMADGAAQSRRWWPRRPPGAVPGEAAKSRVVLVHALGGSGKSRLLRQFRAIALGGVPGSPVPAGKVGTVWLDWEDEQRDDPGSYAGAAGPSLVTVLDAVQKAVVDALGSDGRTAERARQAFGEYRQGAARMPEYAGRFADVVAQSRQSGSPFTSQDAAALAKTAASAGLVAIGHPGGVLGLSPDQLGAAAQAGGHLSEAAIRAVTGKKPGEISAEEYDLVTDPARELPRRAAAAVRTIAGLGPLLVLLDTGEVIGDRAWGWLRRVMTLTGSRVAWVVAARFETEAEAGADSPVAQFVRDIGDEHLVLMSPTRFDDAMIRAYLESRPGARSYSDEQIDGIARFTRGLPLAVSLTATLLDEGQPVETVCQETDHGHPSNVVSEMARRYLVHAENQAYSPDDPRRDDLAKILGLALAFQDLRDDPDLLAALWDVGDPLPVFQDLARRYDFVLPTSRRLHQDVRRTLLADLLDPYRRPRARVINQRALTLMLTRLERMRRSWRTLDEQLDHTGFTTALLAALWHTLWTDNQAGLDLLSQILPVLTVTGTPAAETAADMAGWFAGTFDEDQRGDLDQLLQLNGPGAGMSGRQGAAAHEAGSAILNMTDLALRAAAPGAGNLLAGEASDRQVAVMVLRASSQTANHDHQAAVATLQTAAAQTTSNRLRRAIGELAKAIASTLIWPDPRGTPVLSATGLAAAKLATGMLPQNAAAWHSYGLALYSSDRYEDALAAYDQALALDPDPATYTNRAAALLALGRPEDALAAANQAIALDLHLAAAHLNRGNSLFRLGRFEDALAAFDQALALDPGNASAHSNRGGTLYNLKRFEDALIAFDQELALRPRDAEAHKNRGFALFQLGRADDALAAFDQAIALNPGNAHAHRGRGLALRALGRPEDAVAAYDQALTLDPRNADALTNRGTALQALGRPDDALAAYDQALTLDPRNADALTNRGTALGALGRPDDALAAFDQVLALNPGNADAHNGRGMALRDQGRPEDALAAFDRALALNPGNADVHKNRGQALFYLGRPEDAVAAFDQAIALNPLDAGAHVSRGLVLLMLGRPEDAVAAFDQAIALNRGNADVHHSRGMALQALGRPQDAVAAYDQALALDPRNADAHYSRGVVLGRLRRFDEAVAAFDQGLALDPGNADARVSRGLALLALGRSDDALAAFDQALALDPRNADALTNRGTALSALGRPEDALAAYDQAIALDPHNARTHNGRGLALFALRRFDDALAAYDEALVLNPGDADARLWRGRALLALGRSDDALAASDWILSRDSGKATAYMLRGAALRDQGRFDDALTACDQALALDPGEAGAHVLRGYILLYLERFEDALAANHRALALNPGHAGAHENQGIVLTAIGDLDQALAEFDAADRLAPERVGEGRTWAGAILWHHRDPAGARNRFTLVKGRVTGCTPFHTAEMEAVALCGLGRPAEAEQHLLAALPLRAPGDQAVRAIYDLLSNPPAPGIDHLRAIADNDT
jgi:tetratricopeptide (TPR) repeat protein